MTIIYDGKDLLDAMKRLTEVKPMVEPHRPCRCIQCSPVHDRDYWRDFPNGTIICMGSV